ncbi:hypothetical protein AB3Z07_24640 [Metabacillus halosaccharovorans]|uniref:hypothetical protein n=1 Tax=Bacillaceae TaxID=186817 RepID=UPI00047E24C4|nr:hypothetical protein [Bacillus sp. J37]
MNNSITVLCYQQNMMYPVIQYVKNNMNFITEETLNVEDENGETADDSLKTVEIISPETQYQLRAY